MSTRASCRWLLAALPLAACAAPTYDVQPGHRAVLTDLAGVESVADEGEVAVPDGATLDDFDLRQVVQTQSFDATTADGVPISARGCSISWQFVPEELVDLDHSLDGQNAPQVVNAIVGAQIARVLGTYRWDALDPAHIREAQAMIESAAAIALRPRHITLTEVDLKGLVSRLPGLSRNITATSIWEQRVAAEKARVETARQQAESLRAQAEGIAAANRSIAPTLTDGVLADKSNRAWQALLQSPTTAVEISNEPSPSLEVAP